MNVYPIKCRIRAEADAPTRVDVYDDVGPGGWFSDGLTAKDFAATMAPLSGPLEVHINSAGGDVFDGIAIGNALRAHQGHVTVVVDGLAASIASVIAQAGQDRVMQPGSMMMIHDAFGMAIGDAAEMTRMAQTLDQVSDNIAGLYAARAGGTAESWRTVMRGEAWYDAEQAVSAGLADRVGAGAAQMPPGLDVAAMVPGRIAARLRAASASHTPLAGTHHHGHSAYGHDSGDDDGSHSHPHAHDNDADHGHGHDAAPADRAVRVLGIESMPPLADKALPVHHTATVDEPWDGPAAVAAMPADDTVLKYCHAWESAAAAAAPRKEGDDDADDQKGNYKFPHHKTDGGPANLAACRNGLARLPGADIPDGDRAGVKAHLRDHIGDAGDDGADDHSRTSVFAADAAERYRAALKGARKA